MNITDIWSMLGMIVAGFVGSVVSAATGAGGSITLSLILAPIIGIAAIVQTVSVAMLVSHIGRIGVFWSDIDWPVCRLVIFSSAPGVALGAYIYTFLEERMIAVLLGVFLVVLVAVKRLMPREVGRWSSSVIAGSSLLYGILAGATIGGGVLLLPILRGAGLAGLPFAATDSVLGLATTTVKTVVFASSQILTANLVYLGIIVGLCMIPGTLAAKWLLKRISLGVHSAIIDGVIVVAGLAFLWRAIA